MKLTIILLILSLNTTFAFTLSNSGRVKLPDPKVGIVVASNTCSAAGFNSAQEFADLIKESVDEYWNRVPTCALELEVEGVDSSIDTTSDTLTQAIQKARVGKILIGCSDNSSLFDSASILGVGSINTLSGDRGVLLINNASSTFANQTQQEKLAIIAHELGHAFGLGHSGDPTALMYYAIGGKIQEKLTIDDYDGCSYLYPHSAPGSCSAVPLINYPGEKNPPSGGSSQESSLLLTILLGLLGTLGLISLKDKIQKDFRLF